jgi:predicted secreted protein
MNAEDAKDAEEQMNAEGAKDAEGINGPTAKNCARMPREERRHGSVTIDDVAHDVIRAAMTVYREVGAGWLERAYDACLRHELSVAGYDPTLKVERSV